MTDDKKPDQEADRVRNPSDPDTATPNASPAHDRLKADLIRHLRADLGRTGRRYLIDLAALDVQSLREFIRLVRDLDADKQAAIRKARLEPWRRW